MHKTSVIPRAFKIFIPSRAVGHVTMHVTAGHFPGSKKFMALGLESLERRAEFRGVSLLLIQQENYEYIKLRE